MLEKSGPRNNLPAYSQAVAKRIKGVIWLVLMLTIFYVINLVSSLFGADWFRHISPFNIFSLSKAYWGAFLLTAGATIIGFCVAWVLGGLLGGLAAALVAARSAKVRIIGVAAYKIFDFFYIIPVVVTLGLVFATLLQNYYQSERTWIIAAGAICSATFLLGGYQIFEAIYRSAAAPSFKNQALIESIFSRREQKSGWLAPIVKMFVKAGRLRDANILSYKNAIIRAFHLSLVSVVIVESIRPLVYEYVFPQTGFEGDSEMFGGVGHMILKAQITYDIDVIVGLIWLLFIFDAFVVLLLDWLLGHRYLRHYQK